MTEIQLSYPCYTIVKMNGKLYMINTSTKELSAKNQKHFPVKAFGFIHHQYQLVEYIDAKVEHVVLNNVQIVKSYEMDIDSQVNSIMGAVFEMGEYIWVFEHDIELATMREVHEFRGAGICIRMGVL